MSDHYKLSNKINFPPMSPTDIKRILYPKQKSSFIERGKKKLWSIKHRHWKDNPSKEKISSRCINTKHQKIQKPWKILKKKFILKKGLFLKISYFNFIFSLFRSKTYI